MALTRTTIAVEEELLAQARELDVNVSETARTALRQAVWAARLRRAEQAADPARRRARGVVAPAAEELAQVREERGAELEDRLG